MHFIVTAYIFFTLSSTYYNYTYYNCNFKLCFFLLQKLTKKSTMTILLTFCHICPPPPPQQLISFFLSLIFSLQFCANLLSNSWQDGGVNSWQDGGNTISHRDKHVEFFWGKQESLAGGNAVMINACMLAFIWRYIRGILNIFYEGLFEP